MKKINELFYYTKLRVRFVPNEVWWSICTVLFCIIAGYILYVNPFHVENNQINFYEQKFYFIINTFGINFTLSCIFILSLIYILIVRLNIMEIITRIIFGLTVGVIFGSIIWFILFFVNVKHDLLSNFTLAINFGVLLGLVISFITIFTDVVLVIKKIINKSEEY